MRMRRRFCCSDWSTEVGFGNRFAETPGYGQTRNSCAVPDIVCRRVPFDGGRRPGFIALPLVICDHCVVSTITSCYEQFSPEFYWAGRTGHKEGGSGGEDCD